MCTNLWTIILFPAYQQLTVRAGDELHLISYDSSCKSLDPLPVLSFRFFIDRFTVHWPMIRLSVDVEEYRVQPLVLGSVDLRPQGEGVFDELSHIKKGVEIFVYMKSIPDSLVALHAIAPDRPLVGIGKVGAVFSPKGFKPFGFNAYECRRCADENIQNRMSPTFPGEADSLLKI